MSKEMREQIDRVKNWKQFNESEQIYPYDDKSRLVLSISYVKRGVEQQANIEFVSGELVTKYIDADYEGRIDIPETVKTMKDVVDFIVNLSYNPKNFVKIVSVKYPLYKSPHTTHLIVDEEKTNELIEYLNKKMGG
jgi:hypothetical protein